MSRLVFTTILNEVLSGIRFHVDISDTDREQLYQEALHYFGLVGGPNICEALEAAWRDPYNQSEIRDFITAWLRKKAKKEVKVTGVI
ncbi:MAG: hypothetical protein AOA66_0071 [Candidatus Bathyarchaeota archaeon BA2]|nr:MAG: hypothetical protein AOA66_0071 [Candidatus Bathyarchaeota archaeon BA2]